eukprot:gene10406-21703_t
MLASLIRVYILIVFSVYQEFVSADFSLSLKRIIILTAIFFCLPILIIWNHVGFALDDILYPDWKKQTVEAPVFIIGNARSGTTWFHRLLAAEEDTFTSLRTWELLLGVSVTWRRLILNLYRIDSMLGSPLMQCLQTIEQRLGTCIMDGSGCSGYSGGSSSNDSNGCQVSSFSSSSTPVSIPIHAVGLQLAEEDEWLMLHLGLSQLTMMLLPLTGPLLDPLVTFDTTLTPPVRMKILQFYKQCVQRHMYGRKVSASSSSSSRNRVFLSKNPAFTLRLDSLMEVFPDCRVVCMARDPLQAVPSLVSYLGQ